MIQKRICSLLLFMYTMLSAFTQQTTEWISKTDMDFLKKMTVDVLESSKIKSGESISKDFGPNSTGGILIRPGGRDCYPAFWIRDYSMSLDCGMVPEKDQLHMLRLTASTQCDQTWITKAGGMIPFGSIADHIRIDDSLPIFYPGTYSYEGQGEGTWGKLPCYDDQFFFIHMAYYYVKSTRKMNVLNEVINGFKLMDRLEFAFRMPSARLDNHIVNTTEDLRAVDFGFRDVQTITGDLSITSVFKYKSALEIAELYAMQGNKQKSNQYKSIAAKLKESIPALFMDDRGMLLASNGLSKQADVWSTALAIYYGILEGENCRKACSTLAKAYQEGSLSYKGNIRHILTTDDYDETTAWERSLSKISTYQNGSYWGTPTGWVCFAIAKVNKELSRKLANEYIEELKENDYRKGDTFGAPYECFNKEGYSQNPVYLTTVTCPFAVFNK